MLREIRPAVVMLVLLTVITGVVYPLVVYGIGQAAFPWQANGSLVVQDGKVVGSALIGQDFDKPGYFHPRPSATTAPDPKDASKTVPAPYNAAASLGSNLGPTSKALVDRVQASVTALKAENPDAAAAGLSIPEDLVTTSASGLDPAISPEAARFQVPRIAKARNLPRDKVQALVDAHTTRPLFGFLGAPQVNVLALNLALDQLR